MNHCTSAADTAAFYSKNHKAPLFARNKRSTFAQYTSERPAWLLNDEDQGRPNNKQKEN
jgi:hypothetical protein